MNIFKYLLLFIYYNEVTSFVTNANLVISSEQKNFNDLLERNNLLCHLQSARVKSFESSLQKLKNLQNDPTYSNIKDVYDLYDLIGFRYVFYTKEDLLKFYHHIKMDKNCKCNVCIFTVSNPPGKPYQLSDCPKYSNRHHTKQ